MFTAEEYAEYERECARRTEESRKRSAERWSDPAWLQMIEDGRRTKHRHLPVGRLMMYGTGAGNYVHHWVPCPCGPADEADHWCVALRDGEYAHASAARETVEGKRQVRPGGQFASVPEAYAAFVSYWKIALKRRER